MIDEEIAGSIRLLGLMGLGVSLCMRALGERSGRRKTLVSVSAGAALVSALVYFIGVMAAAHSGASLFLPRFP